MTLHSSLNSSAQKAMKHRSDAACAAAITHALKYHYQLLINIVSPSSGFGLLERVAADACLRAAQFTIDPKVIEAVMLPHNQGGPDHHRRQSGKDELSSSHSSTGVLMFMKDNETLEAIRAIRTLEDSNPYTYFGSAIRRFGSSSTSTSTSVGITSPMTRHESTPDEVDECGRPAGGDIKSLSQLFPPRYILHALATRLDNTPFVQDDRFAEEARGKLAHLFLEGVHVLLSSLQAVVRVPGESYSLSSLDLAKSIWFAAPPGLSFPRNITHLKPLSNEEAFDRDMSSGTGGGNQRQYTRGDAVLSLGAASKSFSPLPTSTTPVPSSAAPPSMRVVLLYNLLVGRLYDDYFDEDAFVEFQIDGLEERVERGLCASILSVDHPFSLQFGVLSKSTTSAANGSVNGGGECGDRVSSNPTRFQGALTKAIQQERSRFGRLCYRYKGGEKRGRSDQGNSMGDDGDADGIYNLGRKRDVYVPDPNEVDPRIQRWGTSTSRRIRFVDDILSISTPPPTTTTSNSGSRTSSPPSKGDDSVAEPLLESYRSFITGGMGLIRPPNNRSSSVTSGLEEVFMVPTFHSQYGLQ